MTTTTPKVKFETEPCSRCGGTGEFSFNQLTGTKCFKCGNGPGVVGTGLQLSRRGRAARKAYDAVMARMNRTYGDVVVGDRVKLAIGMSGPKWRTVTAVSVDNSTYVNGTPAIGIDCGNTGFVAPAVNLVMVWSADIYHDACVRVSRMAGATVTGLVPIEPTAVEAAIAGTGSLGFAAQPVTVDELVKLIDNAPTTYEVLTAPLGTPIVNADGSPIAVKSNVYRSHAKCGHERTPAARAKCRRNS